MDKSKKRWLIVLGIVLLVGLIILALVLGWFSKRGKAFDSRPLVLIISPDNNEKYQEGDGILVHATAREDNGLARIELWVNDSLVDALDAEDQETNNMVLLSSWVPTYEGRHQIIVRATSNDGIDGQSMVQIYTIGYGEDSTRTYTVEDGETLESIADDLGSTPEELTELNPELGPGGPAPGDDLIVPDDDPPSDDEPPSFGETGDPPSVDPGSPLVDFPFSIVEMVNFGRDEMVDLRVELTALRTWEDYERLHCYVGVAGELPQWYPDQDRNQATGETFEKLGRGWWNTEETMQGNAAPVVRWPGNQPLTASISCIGITGGGTESVELEKIEIEIPPEEWNGLRYSVTVEGSGGRLLVETSVRREITPDRLIPKWPDPDMTIPTNVRINEENRTVEWDYNPRDDELPIDGFWFYLNENRQFTVDERDRETRLPVEWFEPPCGEQYVFSVTAFRIEGDDWPESFHGSVSFAQEECTRQVEVTFLTLETYHLGGDGSSEDRHGDKGPAYGVFFANRESVGFDHGHEGRGLDMPDGLRHNTTYDLLARAADRGWHFTQPIPRVVTEVSNDGRLFVGVTIEDRDTGRCRYEGDNGCDDLICTGRHTPILFEDLIEADGELLRSEFTTREGRCRIEIEYRLLPAWTGPYTGNEGVEPLPYLQFIDLDVDPITGETAVEIQNTGTAEWPGYPLTVELLTPGGDSLRQWTFEDVEIPVLGFETVTIPAMAGDPVFDVCVFLDPEDEVLELYELTGSLPHYPLCPGLPDLTIEYASYEDRGENYIYAQIQNVGTDDLENRQLFFEIRYPDGGMLADPIRLNPVSIAAGGSQDMLIGPLDESARPRMAGGYVLEINADGSIAEENYANNIYEVDEATRLALYLTHIKVPYSRGDEAGVDIDVYVHSGRFSNRQVIDWHLRGIDWDNCREHTGECDITFFDDEYYEPWFEILSDETLVVVVTYSHPDSDWSPRSYTRTFYPPDWRAEDIDRSRGYCHYDPSTGAGLQHFAIRWGDWESSIKFCRENYGE